MEYKITYQTGMNFIRPAYIFEGGIIDIDEDGLIGLIEAD